MTITTLLKQAYSQDIELWCEDGKLKYRAARGALSDETKRDLTDNKTALIVRLEQNAYAKGTQWIIFDFGEMYSKRTGQTSDVCIFRNEDETFSAWRGNWKPGEPRPVYQKTIVDNVGFNEAFEQAQNYINWLLNNPKSRRRRAS